MNSAATTTTTAAGPLSPLEGHMPLAMDSYASAPRRTATAVAASTAATQDDDTSEGYQEESDDTDTPYTLTKRPSSQSLTKESLMLFNLKHASQPLRELPTTASIEASNFTTTPELTSSSSVTSFDEQSEDSKAIQRLYNNSNSSIATIVQRLTSSTSTLNLQNKHTDDTASDTDKSIIPQTRPSTDKLAKDLSTTSLSSLTSNNDTTGVTTDTNSVKGPRRLKSSLKLPSLTRCKSMPSAKTVRFSSDLEKVKTFNEFAKPSSISLDNSPEQSPPTSQDYDEEVYGTPKAFFQLNSSSFYTNSSSDSDESEEDYFTYKSKLKVSKWKLKNMNFELFSNVRSFNVPPVKLGSLTVSDNLLRGTVEVVNFSFEKYVEVKFTTDSWNSIYLVTGSYDRALDSNRDQFKFEINLNKSIMMNSYRMLKKNSSTPIRVELCVKYIAGGSSTYYDNNNNQNYKFELVNQVPENKKPRTKGHGRSSSIDSNFVSAKINDPPKVISGGRYFSEDTDYFNRSPNKMKWLDTNFQSSFATTSSSSTASSGLSTSKSSSNSSSDTLTKTINSSTVKYTPSSTSATGGAQSYTDFLQKYCFFKSDDPRNVDSESVFIR